MFSVALCGAVGAYCRWKRLADVFTMVFGCLCWICMLHDVYCGFWYDGFLVLGVPDLLCWV